ncbi:hypothetical protein B2J86_06615 [Acidovorax sp. SRB_14]|uniref:DUF2970 domain-containing protein n=1 Tax=unclassified Acidovorax TaxID=2684926 RepID=UPI00145F93A4|nr:hypothetical protein [Acidovorax sp. SRB_24]NMM80604.1 hypothetical protein [Acidovorax sp. SRB_14]NMM89863.1 hypothetical protein [Rhodococcus sp. SRB_17]
MSEEHGNDQQALRRKGSLLRTIRAVAWAFIGLRKGSEYQKDLERINPLHIIAVGLVAFFLLVFALIAVVNWVV